MQCLLFLIIIKAETFFPDTLYLYAMTLEDLDHCLQFFAEVRKQNGENYPPGSLKDLASMLQLYISRSNW